MSRYVMMYWNQPWWLLSSIHSCGVKGAKRTHEHYLKSKSCTLWSLVVAHSWASLQAVAATSVSSLRRRPPALFTVQCGNTAPIFSPPIFCHQSSCSYVLAAGEPPLAVSTGTPAGGGRQSGGGQPAEAGPALTLTAVMPDNSPPAQATLTHLFHQAGLA
jgi:hypothetical protein